MNDYPSHEFVIGYEEAQGILGFEDPNDEQQAVLDELCKMACDEDGCKILNGRAGCYRTDDQNRRSAPVSRCSGRTAGSPLRTRSARLARFEPAPPGQHLGAKAPR